MNTCPDCKCDFVQPFRCVTCGAQKLYDHTVTSQAATIEALRARVAELEEVVRMSQELFECGLIDFKKYGFKIDADISAKYAEVLRQD